MHLKIMKFMALDNQPFSVEKDQKFFELVAQFQPRYLIPSRMYFSETMLPEVYNELSATVMKELAAVHHVLFTTDIWTNSHSNNSFLSMTARWVTDSLTSKQCVLHCNHFPGNHSSINIAANFKTLLLNWNISEEQVHIVVRDNAYNMQLGMELLKMDSMPCFIHVLQLVIKDSLFSGWNDQKFWYIPSCDQKIGKLLGCSVQFVQWCCTCTLVKE